MILHLLGLLAAIHAIVKSSTAQGAIAWTLGLLAFPGVVLPIYLVFGSSHMEGYIKALRSSKLAELDTVQQALAPFPPFEPAGASRRVLQELARVPFAGECQLQLLIDGEATYGRMHEEIERAESYVLVLFFRIFDDVSGRALQATLMEKARQGVRVYFVYDEVGSTSIRGSFVAELRRAGVEAWPFSAARGWRHVFQLNFRNHRKIVVVDGKVALVGGMNFGDRYLGRSQHFGAWRDTHLLVRGPAVLGVQLVFMEDYYQASGGKLPQLSWVAHPAQGAGRQACTYLACGPSTGASVCLLFYLECIRAARHRLWLASPYFVPDASIVEALRLADLRGVEVRILLPPGRFEPFMRLAAMSCLEQLSDSRVQFYEYDGYNHSKVMLVDDELAWVGSSNLDNRSLRLNFEGNLVVEGAEFAGEVEAMFERDFARARLLSPAELSEGQPLRRLASRMVRLLGPVL